MLLFVNRVCEITLDACWVCLSDKSCRVFLFSFLKGSKKVQSTKQNTGNCCCWSKFIIEMCFFLLIVLVKLHLTSVEYACQTITTSLLFFLEWRLFALSLRESRFYSLWFLRGLASREFHKRYRFKCRYDFSSSCMVLVGPHWRGPRAACCVCYSWLRCTATSRIPRVCALFCALSRCIGLLGVYRVMVVPLGYCWVGRSSCNTEWIEWQ